MTTDLTPQALKRTTMTLAFIQVFSTMSFAVLYSTLILYATQKLKLSIPAATAMMGTFGAFNYGLHLLGGYFGGRLFSWRFLFTIGMLSTFLGCMFLSIPEVKLLYVGLTFFLIGSGLNVTCLNMMVTQLFEPNDKRRETAFFWNYAAMNVGFIAGFCMAGHYQLKQDFHTLFVLSGFGNLLAGILVFFNWKRLNDVQTILSSVGRSEYTQRFLGGMVLILLILPTLAWLVKHAVISNQLTLVMGVVMAVVIGILALRQQNSMDRSKIAAYLIFCLSSVIFWTLYQLMPMALTVFAQYNINRHVYGIEIAPQWIQNINSIVIVLGGPLLGYFFQKYEQRGGQLSLSFKFSLALMLIGAGLVILPIGIKLAASNGLVSFKWIFYSYVVQSIGELFIGPIGYAMVGQLAPQKYQGLMMGTWMMTIGIGFALSSYASTFAIKNMTTTNPLLTNPGYAYTFNLLGWVSVGIGFVLFIFTPLLKRLTYEKR